MTSRALQSADIIVVGAGIIGLSVALELRLRGADVTVFDKGQALSQASTAAAGMLAASDPHNPLALQDFSTFSLTLYGGFLETIQTLSGLQVPYQTATTIQYAADGTRRSLKEHSLDPRQLAAALLRAVHRSAVIVRERTVFPDNCVPPHTRVIYTTGAWADRFQARPRKGQMLRVALPQEQQLEEVHRAEHVYVVPRTAGPQAGTALVGATVEDAGFDLCTDEQTLTELRQTAADLHPSLRFLRSARTVEAWAGLRPSTPDNLPVIGEVGPGELVATGHYRNGILLAPATAKIIANLVADLPSPVDLQPFRPDRFHPEVAARVIR